ncbi:hypothetical protein PDJAM_G00190660 [Pangasius djambal]|uniref:Uncharacterized protein n=1 Tax=Pangasius djambal TaxID=1691987 RepID=A0ACC5Y5G6_9TELE|nr:hypothetical protein [Pangasius djambal]
MKTKNIDHQPLHTVLSGLDHMTVVCTPPPFGDEGKADEDVVISRTSPGRKPIIFSISNAVAKPSSSPTVHVTESKVTSRADSVGNRMPYGQWIPVKTVSSKKR